jgi:hypothetical protein
MNSEARLRISLHPGNIKPVKINVLKKFKLMPWTVKQGLLAELNQ